MLVFFYIFATLAVLGALGVLLLPSPVYCALSLVATLISVAGIFLLLNQEFVAAIQVLVYAGAIMVLFLFVIMLLNLRSTEGFRLKWSVPKMLGVALAAGLLAQLVGLFTAPAARLGPPGEYTAQRLAEEGAVEAVGNLLFTRYVLPFEVISILLMVAVMGAVVLAKRRPAEEGGEQP